MDDTGAEPLNPGDWVRVIDTPELVGRVIGRYRDFSNWIVVDYYDLASRKQAVHRGAYIRGMLAKVASPDEIIADYMLTVLEV